MATVNAFIAPLPHLSIIQISGEQRHEYLHGQITVATKGFSDDQCKFAAHCDFKGKMFSASYVTQYNQAMLLTTHHEAAKESLIQLKKYGVFSKVDITESTVLKAYGLWGREQMKALNVLFSSLSQAHMSVVSNEFGQVITFNDTSLRFLCLLNETGYQRMCDILENPELAGPELWESLEIMAGIGNVQGPTLSTFVPQMLNMQCLNGIDFDKGCYMGQEVVARTKFLGKNKRATFILSGVVSDLPQHVQVGANIEVKIGDNWRRGGVINRISLVDNTLQVLGVMANDTEVNSVARVKDTDIMLKVNALPYEIQ